MNLLPPKPPPFAVGTRLQYKEGSQVFGMGEEPNVVWCRPGMLGTVTKVYPGTQGTGGHSSDLEASSRIWFKGESAAHGDVLDGLDALISTLTDIEEAAKP